MAFKKQFAVLGLGIFGGSVAKTLVASGYDVMGVDIDPEIVQDSTEYLTHSVVADVSDEGALRAIGIRNFEVVVIATSASFETTVLATLICKELGAGYVLAKAKNGVEAKILTKIGADKVVQPEVEMGEKVAMSLISGNVLDSISLSADYSVVEIKPLGDWVGQKISDINPLSAHGLSIIAAHRGKDVIADVDSQLQIQEHDILVVVGSKANIGHFVNKSGDIDGQYK